MCRVKESGTVERRHLEDDYGSVPNAFRLKNRIRFLVGREFERDPTHLHHFSIEGLQRMLGSQFKVVRIRPSVGRFVGVWPRMTANDLVWCVR